MSDWDQASRKQYGRAGRAKGTRATRIVAGVIGTILLLAGIGTGVAAVAGWSDADEPGRAAVCTAATGPGQDCVSWTNAKIVSFVDQGGKHSVYELDVADDGTGLPESFSFQSGNALLSDSRIGAAVQVESWQGAQIAVKAGSLVVPTSASPAIERADLVAGSMMCTGLASFILAVAFGNAGGAGGRSERRPGRGPLSAVAIAVICWSVPAIVAAFVVMSRSMTVNAAFAVLVGISEVVELTALPFVVWRGHILGRKAVVLP